MKSHSPIPAVMQLLDRLCSTIREPDWVAHRGLFHPRCVLCGYPGVEDDVTDAKALWTRLRTSTPLDQTQRPEVLQVSVDGPHARAQVAPVSIDGTNYCYDIDLHKDAGDWFIVTVVLVPST